jgi:hypothetical protein
VDYELGAPAEWGNMRLCAGVENRVVEHQRKSKTRQYKMSAGNAESEIENRKSKTENPDRKSKSKIE